MTTEGRTPTPWLHRLRVWNGQEANFEELAPDYCAGSAGFSNDVKAALRTHDRLVKALEAADTFYADLISDLYSEDHKRGEWLATLKGRVLHERQVTSAALSAAEGNGK